MVGSYNLFHKAKSMKTLPDGGNSEHVAYIRRLYQQAKQVSQIIAYIWRWADEDEEKYAEQKHYANQLKTYFSHPSRSPKDVGGELKKLFRANPNNLQDKSEEAKLLHAVFFAEGIDNQDYIFPIFNSLELGESDPRLGYLFEISVNAFTGSIEDADINSPELLKMTIPYPPRPAFGNANLHKDTLEDWILNRDQNQYFAESHYIPTSCS